MPIVVYTRMSCGPCATLKYWLSKKGISYQEVLFDEHPEDYPIRDFRVFPLIKVGEEYIEGLNLGRLSAMLDKLA